MASVWEHVTDLSPLTGSELFSSLDEDALARVAVRASTVQLERNDTLFHEGDEADHLFVVLTGRVAIAKRAPDGRESLVALMEPGDLFGEMPLFDEEPRSASARALERSELARVPFDIVRSELEARPGLLWDVVALFATRLRAADDALADAMLLDVTGRTAKRLLELSGDADEFVLPITQEELAGLVGASRERVNKAISAFIRLGWIDQADRHYRILKRDRLVQRAR
jgi:CRP-like cAMP-binding protein